MGFSSSCTFASPASTSMITVASSVGPGAGVDGSRGGSVGGGVWAEAEGAKPVAKRKRERPKKERTSIRGGCSTRCAAARWRLTERNGDGLDLPRRQSGSLPAGDICGPGNSSIRKPRSAGVQLARRHSWTALSDRETVPLSWVLVTRRGDDGESCCVGKARSGLVEPRTPAPRRHLRPEAFRMLSTPQRIPEPSGHCSPACRPITCLGPRGGC